MSAFGDVYVIDNNALSQIKRERRAGDFFRQHCRIPSEVLHEAQGFPDIGQLRQLEYPTTPGVIANLIEVMASVPVGETKLVDLYANLGNADPLVVATALDGQRTDDAKLFAPTWTVVTSDKAVQAKAREFGLAVHSNEDFLDLVEAAEGDGDG
ncbi:hypothetical protein [Tsukamurella pseudospumae]|uniref:PIN domain-containing protein n=1 Tax=Tsukamurella pseudospumae TaxID=239498 RepID=A0A138AEB6_9ACTN|nr:hypothetical protein [Tsukamurella pseudospumae]KXP08804.1 hypothetical protein AXK60_09060 [Tsukamurella pseudospumae]